MKIDTIANLAAHSPALTLSPEFPRTPAFTPIDDASFKLGSRFERFVLHSAFLPNDREICIYLPAVYRTEPARKFPVLYLHDGQNLFDPRTSYVPGHTWRAHTTADQLAADGQIEPLILVGIANTGVHRMAEYTPTEDPVTGGGQGLLYGRLLVEELKPFIDRTYRTLSDGPNTGLGGSSLGGLISLFLGLRYPRVFGKLAVLSPSIWWDKRSIFNFVSCFDPVVGPDLTVPTRPRIWLDIGTAEGNRHVRDTDLLHRLLVARAWRDSFDISYRKFHNAAHSEDAWARRFDDVLRFLFPRGHQGNLDDINPPLQPINFN